MSRAAPAAAGRRWLLPALAAVAALAVAGMALSAYLVSSWSDLRVVSAGEAEREFDEAIVTAGGGPSYLTISPAGALLVRRELEGEPVRLARLWILAWDPERSRLLRSGVPFWFVRAKMTDSVNLGTLASALSGDWKSLGVKVSVEELERSGPGIVLDHRLASGGRLLLWTEAKVPYSRRPATPAG